MIARGGSGLALALLVPVLLAACPGTHATCPIAPPVTAGPPFLWRVQAATGEGPVVWLYGTIHDETIDAVPAAALTALDGSPRFASELGDGDPDPSAIEDLIRIKSGKGIDQLLPADDWYDLRDELDGVIKEDDLRRVKPWYAMSLLTSHMVKEPPPRMDVQLASRARAHHLPVDPLETWQAQLSALDGAVTVADLLQTIRERHTIHCHLDVMRQAYDAGDLVTMSHFLLVEGTEHTLLATRNKEWLAQIEGYLTGGGAFVAVGLGHLLGDAGLPALLEHAGYRVVQVTPTPS